MSEMTNELTRRTIKSFLDSEGEIQYATRFVTERLLQVMKSHIGRENAVTREDLLKKLFRINYYDISELHRFFLLNIMNTAMHRLRKNTKCFITSKRNEGTTLFFVVKSDEDANCYSDFATRQIRSLRQMERRAYTAVREKWYKDEWALGGRRPKTISLKAAEKKAELK